MLLAVKPCVEIFDIVNNDAANLGIGRSVAN